jgi:hypothetical protein
VRWLADSSGLAYVAVCREGRRARSELVTVVLAPPRSRVIVRSDTVVDIELDRDSLCLFCG